MSSNSINSIRQNNITESFDHAHIEDFSSQKLQQKPLSANNQNKHSKALMKKAKYSALNQGNIKNIISAANSPTSFEQQIIDSDLAIIEAQVKEYFTSRGAVGSSACIYAINHAKARYLIQRGTPEALTTLDRLNLRPYI